MPELDFSTYIAEKTRRFAGREWVFAEIERWLADPQGARIYLITGPPGSGKTALVARLTQIRLVHAWYFCEAMQTATLDALTFCRSLSGQLARNLPGFTHPLEKQASPMPRVGVTGDLIGTMIDRLVLQTSSVDEAFGRLVLDPLGYWSTQHPGQVLLILVDALDEGVATQIPDLIAKAQNLPPSVRWPAHLPAWPSP